MVGAGECPYLLPFGGSVGEVTESATVDDGHVLAVGGGNGSEAG